MNFEINNSKLEQVIFRYLDNKNFVIKESDYNYYFIDKEESLTASMIRIKKEDMTCIVRFKLSKELEQFFSVSRDYLVGVFTNYVNKTLNIKLMDTKIRKSYAVFFVDYWVR